MQTGRAEDEWLTILSNSYIQILNTIDPRAVARPNARVHFRALVHELHLQQQEQQRTFDLAEAFPETEGNGGLIDGLKRGLVTKLLVILHAFEPGRTYSQLALDRRQLSLTNRRLVAIARRLSALGIDAGEMISAAWDATVGSWHGVTGLLVRDLSDILACAQHFAPADGLVAQPG